MKCDRVAVFHKLAGSRLEFLVNESRVGRLDVQRLLNFLHLTCGDVPQHLVDRRLGGFERLRFPPDPQDAHALDDDIGIGLVRPADRHAGDRVHDIQPAHHFAEDGVVPGADVGEVQPRRRGVRDKKLAAVRVLAGVGHREDARAVVLEVGMKLVGQPVAGVAGAVAQRTAALNHEVLDDPVKNQPVKVRFAIGVGWERLLILAVKFRALGQADKVGDDEWHFLVLEPGRHHAEIRRDNRVNAVGQRVAAISDFDAVKKRRGGECSLLFPLGWRPGGGRLTKRFPVGQVGRALDDQRRAGLGVADRERDRLARGIAVNRLDVDRHNRIGELAKRRRAGQAKRQRSESLGKSFQHSSGRECYGRTAARPPFSRPTLVGVAVSVVRTLANFNCHFSGC